MARLYEITCDDCGDPYDGGATYLTELRLLVRRKGWFSSPIADVCGSCWKKQQRKGTDT